MKTIKINDIYIEKYSMNKPYIIAEIGVNHEGDLDRAKKMIKDVAEAGGNAVKFQVYKAGTLASKNSPAYWDLTKENTESQFELFKKYDKFQKSDYVELAETSRSCGIDFIATPFDNESIDFLDKLVPAFKIASADITNRDLIKKISQKNKPILLSTGASLMSEIWQAIEWIKEEENDQIILLHCTLNYPTNYKNANLNTIKYLNNSYSNYPIGYSDHTLSDRIEDVIIPAWLLGAKVIEKHFTYNKMLKGNDHYHSMDYEDLKKINEKIEFIFDLIGNRDLPDMEIQKSARKFARRSIYASKFIRKGNIIQEGDLASKRPGIGLSPASIELIIGKKAKKNIYKDDIIKLCDIYFEEIE